MESISAEPGAYVIIHKPTGRFYVGSTNNLRRRIGIHRSTLAHGSHRNANLQSTFTSLDDLEIEVAVAATVEQAREGEQKLLDEYIADPACCNIGTGSTMLWRPGTMPDEVIEKTRQRSLGNQYAKGHVVSDEARDAVRQANTGLKRSAETLSKMSESKERFKRPIEIEGVRHDSVRDAARSLGINNETIRTRIASVSEKFANWKFV